MPSVTIDGSSHDALESMDKGELNNTVFQDPVGQGNEAVNAALSDGQEGTQSEGGGRYYLDSLPKSHQGKLQVIHEVNFRLYHCLPGFGKTVGT